MIPLILAGVGAYLVGSGLMKKSTKSYKDGGKTKGSFDYNDIKKGDLVNFGSYGNYYVADTDYDASGGNKYFWVVKEEENRKKSSASGKTMLKSSAKYIVEEYSKGGYMAKGGIYSSDDRWVVTFQNQDSGKYEKVVVRANNKKNAIEIAEDESGLGSDWKYSSAEKEMADGGVIYLESVGTYFRPSDLATSAEKSFSNEGEIVDLADIDNEEWFNALSEKDRATIEKYKAKGGYMAKGGRSMNVTSDTHFGATGSPRTKEKEKVLQQYRTKKFFSVPPNTSNILTDDEIEEDFFVWADKKMSFSGNKEEQRGIKVFSNNYFDTSKTHEENLKKYKSVILGK
jgi:hypothetical protein